MDLYTIFKFLHVMTALAWVGGGLTLLAASIVASRSQGDEGLFKILELMNGLGKTWFVPASMLTVIFGAIATTFGGMWGDAWVIVGLAGFASTFLTGLLLIEPTGRRIAGFLAEGRTVEAASAGRQLMQVIRFDYTVMFVVIMDMVFKPGWSDIVLLAIMALIVAVGGVLFLAAGSRSDAAHSA